MNNNPLFLQERAVRYNYEWQSGLVFSLIIGKDELLNTKGFYYRCNYHSGIGLFEFWKQDKDGVLSKSELSEAEKEQIKFLIISMIEELLREDVMFLTTIEPFSK